jgi:hypothetical protein
MTQQALFALELKPIFEMSPQERSQWASTEPVRYAIWFDDAAGASRIISPGYPFDVTIARAPSGETIAALIVVRRTFDNAIQQEHRTDSRETQWLACGAGHAMSTAVESFVRSHVAGAKAIKRSTFGTVLDVLEGATADDKRALLEVPSLRSDLYELAAGSDTEAVRARRILANLVPSPRQGRPHKPGEEAYADVQLLRRYETLEAHFQPAVVVINEAVIGAPDDWQEVNANTDGRYDEHDIDVLRQAWENVRASTDIPRHAAMTRMLEESGPHLDLKKARENLGARLRQATQRLRRRQRLAASTS